ncbi:MAG: hypothetical protein Hals2KO_10890 [Halioglobus sp.]
MTLNQSLQLLRDLRRRGKELICLAAVTWLALPIWPLILLMLCLPAGRAMIMRGLARLGGLDQLIRDIMERLQLTPARLRQPSAQPLVQQLPESGETDQDPAQRLELLLAHLCPQQRHLLSQLGGDWSHTSSPDHNVKRLSSASTDKTVLRLAADHAARMESGQRANVAVEVEFQRGNTRYTSADSKPSLALVSPMPPTASGIANYCSDILPALANHYEITLVVQDPRAVAAPLAQRFKTMGHQDFLLALPPFDRIMYHFGNSHLHYDYFTLLKARPGLVVLHDIFLGDCIFSHFEVMGKTQLRQQIYLSHGWPALPHCVGDVRDSIARYPACAQVFTESLGVIVHNRFAEQKLRQHFSRRLLNNLHLTPLAQKPVHLQNKASARGRLQISRDAIVYASFGFINQNKCIFELLDAWKASGLGDNSRARLYFVGDCDDAALRRKIDARILELGFGAQVVITGYVDASAYDDYLATADIALQLRRNSRGESSAALLDCMAAGLTTIINAHGSMAEFPDDTVVKVADDFSHTELAEALQTALVSFSENNRTGARARQHVADCHAPEKVVESYIAHMEAMYQHDEASVENRHALSALASSNSNTWGTALWQRVCQISELTATTSPRMIAPETEQLLVDISARHYSEPQGLSRCMSDHLLFHILQDNDLPYRVEPVYWEKSSGKFRYARSFASNLLQVEPLEIYDDPVEIRSGDVYLGLDAASCTTGANQAACVLQRWREHGVSIFNLLASTEAFEAQHDAPLRHTKSGADVDVNTSATDRYLRQLSQHSDGIICFSGSIADSYRSWLSQSGLPVADTRTGHFLPGIVGTEAKPPFKASLITRLKFKPLTKDPYLLLLDSGRDESELVNWLRALEQLWAGGNRLKLLVVSEQKRRYNKSAASHHLSDISEEMRELLFQNATGVVITGLAADGDMPLFEAVEHQAAIFARDHPALRELCGEHAFYYSANDSDKLAGEVLDWWQLYLSGRHPQSNNIAWPSWRVSARQLTGCILDAS